MAGISMAYTTVKTEVVYEVEGFTNAQRSQRAAGILKRALNPDAVLFEMPKEALNPHLVVEEIVQQVGDVAGFTDLGLYRRNAKVNTLEPVFLSPESTQKAINEGVKIQGMLINGSPYVDEARRPIIKVNLSHVPLKCYDTIGTKLRKALSPFRSQDSNEYAELPRMIYLEDEDCFIPAFFQGAPQICYHCRRAGHIRKECQELAKLQCYKCKAYGHLSRYSQSSRKETTFEADMETYEKVREKVLTPSVEQTVIEKNHVEIVIEMEKANEVEETVSMEGDVQAQDIRKMGSPLTKHMEINLVQSEEATIEVDMEDQPDTFKLPMERTSDNVSKLTDNKADENSSANVTKEDMNALQQEVQVEKPSEGNTVSTGTDMDEDDSVNEDVSDIPKGSPQKSSNPLLSKKKPITRQEPLKMSETVVKRPKIVSRMKPAPTLIHGKIKSASTIAEIRKALQKKKATKDALNE
ncbi:hypothetical protein BGW37DRAFT_550443 [Umbelopsis sp. PMI_123]|nr:hypothetical protein BGW37DRAFT_550443 [Umbelopsis sp. PMI_123]